MEKIEEILEEKTKKYSNFKEILYKKIKKYSSIYLVISCSIITIIGILYILNYYNIWLYLIITIIAVICLTIGHSYGLLYYFYNIWFEKKIDEYKNKFK